MCIILWLLLLLLQMFSSSSANHSSNINNNINLPLSPRQRESTNNNNNNNNPWETLKRHALASLARAQNHHVLKRNDVKVPLHPSSFNEYTVNLSFGTPPQTLPFIVDTGSRLTWFPCTYQKYKYNCTNCTAHKIPTAFVPKNSSSSKIVPCQSTQCELLYPGHRCKKNQNPCGYTIRYGTGNATGLLLTETLALGGSLLVVDNFTVGCSVASAGVPPVGIVGFGRAPLSLPSQMGLKSFSHCMVSRDYFNDDNATAVGDLVLTTATSVSKGGGGAKFNYTPFLTNPRNYSNYYYVNLQSISVGGVHVKVPDEYVVPNATGYGGTIIDSGTSFTVMKKALFDLVLEQFKRQVGNKYKRDERSQTRTGLELCYRVRPAAGAAVVGKNETAKLPKLTFIFKAGVEMVLPLSNYFSHADKQRSVLCMSIVSLGDQVRLPPAIILGNYQQQDYYIKYDLENNQLGIRRKKCKK